MNYILGDDHLDYEPMAWASCLVEARRYLRHLDGNALPAPNALGQCNDCTTGARAIGKDPSNVPTNVLYEVGILKLCWACATRRVKVREAA
jgi:hypothetical protein